MIKYLKAVMQLRQKEAQVTVLEKRIVTLTKRVEKFLEDLYPDIGPEDIAPKKDNILDFTVRKNKNK